MIVVLHPLSSITNEERLPLMMGFDLEQHATHCAKLYAEAKYRVVAVLPDTSSLDQAFEYTNTIEELWTNPGLIGPRNIVVFPWSGRSSSVGDIMVRDGVPWVVSSFGFTELTKYIPTEE